MPPVLIKQSPYHQSHNRHTTGCYSHKYGCWPSTHKADIADKCLVKGLNLNKQITYPCGRPSVSDTVIEVESTYTAEVRHQPSPGIPCDAKSCFQPGQNLNCLWSMVSKAVLKSNKVITVHCHWSAAPLAPLDTLIKDVSFEWLDQYTDWNSAWRPFSVIYSSIWATSIYSMRFVRNGRCEMGLKFFKSSTFKLDFFSSQATAATLSKSGITPCARQLFINMQSVGIGKVAFSR